MIPLCVIRVKSFHFEVANTIDALLLFAPFFSKGILRMSVHIYMHVCINSRVFLQLYKQTGIYTVSMNNILLELQLNAIT